MFATVRDADGVQWSAGSAHRAAPSLLSLLQGPGTLYHSSAELSPLVLGHFPLCYLGGPPGLATPLPNHQLPSQSQDFCKCKTCPCWGNLTQQYSLFCFLVWVFFFVFQAFPPNFGDAVGFYVFPPACSKFTPQGAVCRYNQHPRWSCPLPRKLIFI